MECCAVARLRAHMFEERQKSAARPSVDKGTFVKVGLRGERFWCCVKHVRADGSLLAVVDNDLIKSHFGCGDEILLQQTHVLETSHPSDRMTFHSLTTRLGSEVDAAIAWRDIRNKNGVAATPIPGTLYLVASSGDVRAPLRTQH
jgi:hypothetical protein